MHEVAMLRQVMHNSWITNDESCDAKGREEQCRPLDRIDRKFGELDC